MTTEQKARILYRQAADTIQKKAAEFLAAKTAALDAPSETTEKRRQQALAEYLAAEKAFIEAGKHLDTAEIF